VRLYYSKERVDHRGPIERLACAAGDSEPMAENRETPAIRGKILPSRRESKPIGKRRLNHSAGPDREFSPSSCEEVKSTVRVLPKICIKSIPADRRRFVV